MASQEVDKPPMMTYGKFSSSNQSREVDYKIAECNGDPDNYFNGSSTL